MNNLKPVTFYYFPSDKLLSQDPQSIHSQKVLNNIAQLYRRTNDALNVDTPRREVFPPMHTYSHSYSNWNDYAFLYWVNRPISHESSGGCSGKGGGSSSGSGGCGKCDGEAAIVALLIALLASALVAFGFGTYYTCRESHSSRQNRRLLTQISNLQRQLRQIPGEKNPDLTQINRSIDAITSSLRHGAQYRGINAALGAIGTASVAILIIALIGALMHVYNFPSGMPLELLAISGGAALAFSLIAISFNYGFKKSVNAENHHAAWRTILTHAGLPVEAMKEVSILYQAWDQNPGAGRKYYRIEKDSENNFIYWTIESDAQSRNENGIVIQMYRSPVPIIMSQHGYQPAHIS